MQLPNSLCLVKRHFWFLWLTALCTTQFPWWQSPLSTLVVKRGNPLTIIAHLRRLGRSESVIIFKFTRPPPNFIGIWWTASAICRLAGWGMIQGAVSYFSISGSVWSIVYCVQTSMLPVVTLGAMRVRSVNVRSGEGVGVIIFSAVTVWTVSVMVALGRHVKIVKLRRCSMPDVLVMLTGQAEKF